MFRQIPDESDVLSRLEEAKKRMGEDGGLVGVRIGRVRLGRFPRHNNEELQREGLEKVFQLYMHRGGQETLEEFVLELDWGILFKHSQRLTLTREQIESGVHFVK